MTCSNGQPAAAYQIAVVDPAVPWALASALVTKIPPGSTRLHMRSSLLLGVATISLSSIAFAAAASASSSARRLAFLGPARRAASWLSRTTNTRSNSSSTSNMTSAPNDRILDSPSAQRNKDPILSVLKSEVMPLLLRDGDGEASSNKPTTLTVLEIAAGCGVHTLHFARGLVAASNKDVGDGEVRACTCAWYPTDPSAASRDSIDARCAAASATALADEEESSLPPTVTIRPARSLTLDADGVIEGRNTANADGDVSSLPNPVADIAQRSLDMITNINMIHISPWEATQGLMKVSSQLLRPGGILYCYGPYKVNGTAAESNLRFDESLKSRDASWGVRDLEEVIREAERWGLTHVKTVEMPANNLSVIYQKR